MASNPLNLHSKPNAHKLSRSFPVPATLLPQSLPKPFSVIRSLSPPSTREEAISQAKLCISPFLQKSLNNPLTLPTRKLMKQRQPRFRVEIPIADDNYPTSVTSLAAEIFSGLPITKKGSRPNLFIFWSSIDLAESARRDFGSSSTVFHSDIASAGDEILSYADLAVFLAPDASILEEVRMITSCLNPKPVVLFNPKWGFEEEKGFEAHLQSFVRSFDVVYSFMGLEVRGLLSSRKGVVFKWAKEGVVSGNGWVVMVEDEGKKKGELQVVSSFKRRPTIGEVENVLYNLMAANSPVTNTVKFFREMAANFTGKKIK